MLMTYLTILDPNINSAFNVSNLILLAYLIFKSVAFYNNLSDKQVVSRYETINGLRGFLALAVFIHHAVISQQFFRTGEWAITLEYPLYHFAADIGVSLFFIITGFLFWSKVLNSDGQMSSRKFFINRLNRLAPLYLFHVCVIVVLALSVHNFQLFESGFKLAGNIISWFAFGILGQPDINQATKTYTIDAGVIWTLAYEWAFYFALPLMACFHKGRHFVFLLIVIFSYGFFVQSVSNITLFGYGMTAAFLVKQYDPVNCFKSHWFSLVACILLFIAYSSKGQVRHFLFFFIFMLLVHGNSLFGVLKTSPAKLLGTISYSIYLLQGAVLYITFHIIDHFTKISSMDQWVFLLVDAVCGAILISVSSVTYRYVEHPFIVASHSRR